MALGLDAGSVAFKYAIVDLKGNLLVDRYERTLGRPVDCALQLLGELFEAVDPRRFAAVAGTGSAGRLICELLDVPFINELICQAVAIKRVAPTVRTLIEMGGQDSKMLFLPAGSGADQPIVDFAMNTNCAAGTGSFLDQQASRLGIDIEKEFGELALKSANPPRVAGRCSVFAKSDMIHLQQLATPDYDIVAGLCLGLARNLKSNLGRGHEILKPIGFTGGVAANKGVVRALESVFELSPGELIVPECHGTSGAYGAALVRLSQNGIAHPSLRVIDDRRDTRARKEETCEGADKIRAAAEEWMVAQGNAPVREPMAHAVDLTPLREHLDRERGAGHGHDRLAEPSQGEPDSRVWLSDIILMHPPGEKIPAYLGLDVGSISTKIAVIDEQNRVLGKCYLMTAGRPLEAVRKCLADVGRQVAEHVVIRGAGTTGSGRYLTGDFIGADLVINEITAQASAAALIDPKVDTIFEIGGQDSKYIALDGGVVVDFEMNHACAAGTGSFLEERAEELGVAIKGEFSQLAFSSKAPIKLGERCT
ncbi:MAG: BadF/BadG/BcrA/BcrD ATPase family protein, partial [Phycisphaerae bacterium]|nr:BadF/BadG/BcrA/BcrD ATPase family protein [Phycisphaerae bacterium]